VRGRITDQDAVAESLRAAVSDAERDAGVSIDSVTLGTGGVEVKGAQSRGLYEFGRPHEVTPDDLATAVEMLPRSGWSATACCCTAAAGFYSGWPRWFPSSK